MKQVEKNLTTETSIRSSMSLKTQKYEKKEKEKMKTEKNTQREDLMYGGGIQ